MSVPNDLKDRLAELTPDQLDEVRQVAQQLAEEQRRDNRADDTGEQRAVESTDPHGDPMPSGVPAKATLTTKTISGNDYYYYQWRDGDSVKSQYKSPVGGE